MDKDDSMYKGKTGRNRVDGNASTSIIRTRSAVKVSAMEGKHDDAKPAVVKKSEAAKPPVARSSRVQSATAGKSTSSSTPVSVEEGKIAVAKSANINTSRASAASVRSDSKVVITDEERRSPARTAASKPSRVEKKISKARAVIESTNVPPPSKSKKRAVKTPVYVPDSEDDLSPQPAGSSVADLPVTPEDKSTSRLTFVPAYALFTPPSPTPATSNNKRHLLAGGTKDEGSDSGKEVPRCVCQYIRLGHRD
jgi:hypothetical protein